MSVVFKQPPATRTLTREGRNVERQNPDGTLAKLAKVGKGVVISNDATIEDGAILDDFVEICAKVHIGSYTEIGESTIISGYAEVGNNCLIGARCSVRPHCVIEDDVYLPDKSFVGERAFVESGFYSDDPVRFDNVFKGGRSKVKHFRAGLKN